MVKQQKQKVNLRSESSEHYFDDVGDQGSLGPNNHQTLWNKRNRLITVGVVLVVTLGLLLAYLFGGFNASNTVNASDYEIPAAVVSVAKVQQTTLSPNTTLPGTVVSVRDAVIAAETSGKVTSVALVGDSIEKGQPLATIDNKNASQLVAQRMAELARLKSLYQYHKDYFTRVNIDDQRLGIPEIGIAELRSNMETAKADVARAQAAMNAAETDLQRTTITAPFSGRVVSQSIQPGEFAQIGTSVARLVDINSLEISAQVPAALVQPLASGTKLIVSGFGKEVSAPLRALVPVGNQISRTMEVRVSLETPEFLVGSPVRVTLPTAEPRDVLAIPRDAVILRPNNQYIFVVDAQGKAHKRDIKLGYAQGDLIEVIGNVANGDTVIVRGGERLRDGQQVSWTKDKASNTN